MIGLALGLRDRAGWPGCGIDFASNKGGFPAASRHQLMYHEEAAKVSVKLKKLADQVIVITGASSGIGLATAETAARKGAKVVLAARSGETLDEVVGRITAQGGHALAVTCDVSDRAQVDRLADAAVTRFGRIDTWVN